MHDLAPSKAGVRWSQSPNRDVSRGGDHATASTSKATVQRHAHRERVAPVEKANAKKLAELHFDSRESARHRHNAPLTQITQVQYWPRGGAGSTLEMLRLSRGVMTRGWRRRFTSNRRLARLGRGLPVSLSVILKSLPGQLAMRPSFLYAFSQDDRSRGPPRRRAEHAESVGAAIRLSQPAALGRWASGLSTRRDSGPACCP